MNRLFGIAAVVGGLLKVFLSFVRSADDLDLLHTLQVIADLGLVLGLVGIYMLFRDRFSFAGHTGFILALLGLSFVAGPDASLYGVGAQEIGFPVICIGLGLLSAAQLFVSGHPKLAPAVLMSGIVFSLLRVEFLAPATGQIVGGVLFGLGFVIYGAYMIRQ